LQFFNPDGSQLSLLAITEQDELDNPGKQWSISILATNDADWLGKWIALTEPGSNAISDVVGVPMSGTVAFVSDAADFSGFTIVETTTESSSPLDVTKLLSLGNQEEGFKAFFQSDVDAVPEPSTWAMMALGFASLGYFGLRRGRKGLRLSALA
jgi:hypothetical protein